uniref:Helicase ATP-binding domain-containing protein n=1 Tax=viral metagenome TaxID=1070528 RepID=A0A6C0F3B4_9ZZZZ
MNITTEYKTRVCAASYLGTKGYTIPKSVLTTQDLEFLKKDLFLKPQTPGPSFGPALDDAFPVYRENDKKIYVPRFYGIERYGTPERSEIAPGMDIDVKFPRELRDYQNDIVNIYMRGFHPPHAPPKSPQPMITGGRAVGEAGGTPAGILEIYCGAGKCLGIDTPILMYDGTIKLVQNVEVGDVLMGDDSTPRNVLTLARGREKMYRINASDNEEYTVNESHILSLKANRDYGKTYKEGDVHDIAVKDYLQLSKTARSILLGYRAQIEYAERPIQADPYVMGHIMNLNYNLHSGEETSVVTIFRSVYDYIHKVTNLGTTDEEYIVHVLHYWKDPYFRQKMNEFRKRSHIPMEYKCNTREVRIRTLAGILDTSVATNRHVDYYITEVYDNGTLAHDIVGLARSLGFGAEILVTYKGHDRNKSLVRIYGDNIGDIPVERNYFRIKPGTCMKRKSANLYSIKLTELDVDDYYGFEIDGNRRFVLGDHTVTHNTVMALKIVSLLKKKTLILVHKEFLMNQWIERIEEFLPGARVGKIQASVCDIDDKDIVIGMIQTMYNKVFPQEVYSQFGLTIIDEVHRIGSEEFSKTLLKTITPYMLGISATVERKDKLTKLLYMFIGPKIHSMLRKQEDVVSVRGIEFVTNDTEFNEVEYDFRGQPKYSTMISKICAYGPRSDFIVQTIRDLLKENPEGQVMVLAHNRSLLTYMHDCFNNNSDKAGVNHTPPGSCSKSTLAGGVRGSDEVATSAKPAAAAPAGFYVGGMKQKDLQETESKQIVLATYAMAAEALDIKTLSILVMATPKTDITQSVGRILRMKHANPIIVDIIDSHQLFQNQWKLRKRFYKKSNYKIETATSKKYTDMETTEWFKVFDPKIKAATDDDDETDAKKTATEFKGKCCIDISGL